MVAERVIEHLRLLYGEKVAAAVAARLELFFREYGSPLGARKRTELGLSEKDAVLITYPDQVREPGKASLSSLTDFARTHLRGLVSGIHILPFYPWSSDDGFSVKDYFAVEPSYGSWEDIRRLGVDFDLMFDAVFNHMSAQSEWFKGFLAGDPASGDFFVTAKDHTELSRVTRPRTTPLLTEFKTATGRKKVWTTFSPDQVDLNYKNPDVLLSVLKVLLFYVSQGARFIRLDAIAFLWKEIGTTCLHLPQTHRVIQLLRAVLDEVAPQVLLITETNVPHADNLSYFGDGTNEAQLVYNFALPPLVMHSIQTGNAVKLTRWAQRLSLPSQSVTFFNFLASHDGIGVNPVRGILSESEIMGLVKGTLQRGGLVSYKSNPDGTRSPYELNISLFDGLSRPSEPVKTQVNRFMVAQAILLSLAGVPGIYFHSLFGSRNDRTAADETGIPRRINRQKLERAALERELSEGASIRSQVYLRYVELLNMRRGSRAFHPLGKQEILNLDPRLFAVLRTSPDARAQMLCLHNVSNATIPQLTVHEPSICGTRWVKAVSGYPCAAQNLTHNIQPFEVRWLMNEQ